jgi:long-chain acyl-CoA synthetase
MARQSILDSYLQNAQERGSETAALVKVDGRYTPVTWQAMVDRSRLISSALIASGIEPNDRLCIISQTRLDWVVIDMGIVGTGGVTVPIYHSNLPDECQHITHDSGAVLVFAENANQTAKFLAERERLPKLKKIVQMSGEVSPHDGFVVSLETMLAGVLIDDAVLAARQKSIKAESLYSIIYTSGTTGKPKGVIVTHDNMLYEAEAIEQVDILKQSDTELLFLPLAHVFSRVLEIAWLSIGHVMAFAESMDTIKANMGETRPNLMAGVPRVYEKFYTAVLFEARKKTGVTRWLFERALTLSERRGAAKVATLQNAQLSQADRFTALEALQYRVLKKLVFDKIRAAMSKTLGGNMRVMISGGAPLAPKIAYFFEDIGIEILEGFGLTETCAASCVNRPGRNEIGTVGPPLPGTQVSLAADNELLLKGRGVSPGYWNQPKEVEALQDGWFSTGDIAKIEASGAVRIVDRKKDLIVTAGGKNIAPQNLENLIKTSPLISQAVVHGDKRNFLSALITLDADALKHFTESHNLGAGSLAEMSQRPEVFREVERILGEFNTHLARYETIKKFKILEHDFTQETGELTASLKIKRRVINERYKKIFDAFYTDAF